MTDNETIKTLELLEFCKSMARHGEDVLLTPDTIFGIDKIIKSKDKQLEVVKLMHINDVKQKDAEIKRLKETPKCIYAYDGETIEYCVEGPCSVEKTIEEIKSEARKEFWERLKAQNTMDERIVSVKSGDNLLAEMEERK